MASNSKQLLDEVMDITLQAGQLAKNHQKNAYKVWMKEGREPVSDADLAVNRFLHQNLLELLPNAGWLSEETTDNPDRLSKKQVWVVDPIDGTRCFIKGQDDYAVSVALVENGKPVLGVLAAPGHKALYQAMKGEGAYKNNRPIEIKNTHINKETIIQGDKDYFHSKKVWQKSWPTMTFEKVNSMALRMALVAEGSAHMVLPVRPKRDWDLAAADLIIREAGGYAGDTNGKAFIYNQKDILKHRIVGCSPSLLKEIQQRLHPLEIGAAKK